MELAIAIVGGLTALVVLITAYVNYKKEKGKKPAEDNKTDIGNRNGESISTGDSGDGNFAEDNRLKTEQIKTTKQEGTEIEGTVTLYERGNRALTYNLSGIFSNKILTAEYYSRNHNNDEHGSINLKLITNDIVIFT